MNKKGIKKFIDAFIKVLSYVSLVLLLLVAGILLFYIISNQVARSKNKSPIVGLYTIISPSMEPTIKVYDVVLEFRVEEESDLEVGDIITFYSDIIDTGGYTVTHRIMDIKEVNGTKYYVTKGDNNQSIDDGEITFDHIVGKVHYTFPGLGKVQFFLSSRIGWVCIILIPAVLIILMDLIKIKKLFKIKQEIEELPKLKEVEEYIEKEEDKKIRALIEKARRFNNKK